MGGSTDTPSTPSPSSSSSPSSPGDHKSLQPDSTSTSTSTSMTSIIIPVDSSESSTSANKVVTIQRVNEKEKENDTPTTPGSQSSSSSSSSSNTCSLSSPISVLEEKTDEGQTSTHTHTDTEGVSHPNDTSNTHTVEGSIHAMLKKDSIYQMTKEEEELMERVGKGLKEGEVASQCLWVGNVDPEISQTEFKSVFEKYGPVQLIRLFPRSKCAFVTFQKPSHAIKALEMEGKQLGSMMLTLNVGKASRHLWVGNVGPNMSDAELQASFAKFGTVESVRLLRANQCAFVNFSTDVEALRAAEEMNGTELGGQVIVINFQWSNSYKRPGKGGKTGSPESGPQASHARTSSTGSMNGMSLNGTRTNTKTGSPGSRSPERKQKQTLGTTHPPSRQLFVGNIVPNITEETLWSLFARFGELEQIKGFSGRGYAFVIYRSLRVAVWVRDQMTMYPPILGGRPLCVNFGKPPQDSPPGGVDDYVSDGMSLSMPMMSQSLVDLSPQMNYSTLYTQQQTQQQTPNQTNDTYGSPDINQYRNMYMQQQGQQQQQQQTDEEIAMQMNAMNLGMMGLSPQMYVPSHAIMVDGPQQQQQQQQHTNDGSDANYLNAQYQQQQAVAAATAAAQQYAMQQQVSPYGSPYQQYAHLAFSPLPTLSPMLSPHHLLQMQQLQQMSSPQLSHRELNIHSSPLTPHQTNRLAMLQAAAVANTGMISSSHATHGSKPKKQSSHHMANTVTPLVAAAAGPD